jgi:hypothetical protein
MPDSQSHELEPVESTPGAPGSGVPLSSACVFLHPVLCYLVELLSICFVLIGNAGLDGIIGIGFDEEVLGGQEHA